MSPLDYQRIEQDLQHHLYTPVNNYAMQGLDRGVGWSTAVLGKYQKIFFKIFHYFILVALNNYYYFDIIY